MFSEMNDRIVAIKGELRKREKYQTQLADYQEELDGIEEAISQLRPQFASEKKDVERLEHISLANLIATLSGNKDEKLSKEKQEMIAAQHKLQAAEKAKAEIDKAVVGLYHNLEQLKNAENEYQTLLRQKEELIKMSGSPYAAKVFELSEEEGALKAYITELDEALMAGKRVEEALSDAITSLEKAKNWGTWDLFGGGTISDIAKHQKIDQAETHLLQAQTNMRQFQKELLDVKHTALPEVNISGMLKFADFFFDGFITDYMVQGKINNSLEQTKYHYEHVGNILTNLELQSERKRKKLEQIHQDKQALVESL